MSSGPARDSEGNSDSHHSAVSLCDGSSTRREACCEVGMGLWDKEGFRCSGNAGCRALPAMPWRRCRSDHRVTPKQVVIVWVGVRRRHHDFVLPDGDLVEEEAPEASVGVVRSPDGSHFGLIALHLSPHQGHAVVFKPSFDGPLAEMKPHVKRAGRVQTGGYGRRLQVKWRWPSWAPRP